MSAISAAVCAKLAQNCTPLKPFECSLPGDLRPEDPLDKSFLDEPELPGTHLFPEELIKHLQQQLRIATGENGRLRRALATEEARHVGVSDVGANVGGGNHLAAKQIVALAKRVRELSAEGEATKRQLLELRRKESGSVEAAAPTAATQEAEPRDGGRRADTAEHLQEQLSATKLRLCEARNQCQELKQRLQQANKALEDEVGAVAGDSRRGRAQQILVLQRKVAQLQTQLHAQGSAADDRLAPRVRHEERDRRAAIDKMAADLESATHAQEAARLKADTARARCKALEAENAAQRRRIEALADDAEKDTRIIEAIKSELLASTEREAARARELTAASQWREQCEFLREELRRLQMGAVEASHEEAKVQEPAVVAAANATEATESTGIPAPASVEHLLRLTARLEQRVMQERRVAHDAQVSLRKEQMRSARLQTRVASMEAASKAQVTSGSRGYATRRDTDRAHDAAQLAAELLREELLAAQAQLACVEHEKQEDLQLFADALQAAYSSTEGKEDGNSTSHGRRQDGQNTSQGAWEEDPSAVQRVRPDAQNKNQGVWLEDPADTESGRRDAENKSQGVCYERPAAHGDWQDTQNRNQGVCQERPSAARGRKDKQSTPRGDWLDISSWNNY